MTITVSGGALLAGALENVRYEVVPVSDVATISEGLPEGARVTITSSPRLGLERSISAAEELARSGFQVVPHLTARQIRDETELSGIIDRLVNAGIDDIMVLAGDASSPAGPYTSSLDLLRYLDKTGNPFSQIGIAGYPEGHPALSSEGLRQALRSKVPFATYIVTQLCFSPDAVARWLDTIRSDGIHLPVYVGIPGKVSQRRLLSMASKIGVGDSLRFLKRQSGNVFRMMFSSEFDPGDLILQFEPLLTSSNGIAGFHVYTFNAIPATEEWRLEMLHNLPR